MPTTRRRRPSARSGKSPPAASRKPDRCPAQRAAEARGLAIFSDRLRGSYYYGRAESNFDNPIQTTVTLDRSNTQGYSWDFRGNPDAPVINYGFDVTDPAACSV